LPIQDRVSAAKQVDSLLRQMLVHGGFRLKYRITAQPPAQEGDLEHPELLVEFAGPDSTQLVERNGELLRSMEHIATKLLKLEHDEHDKLSFDCQEFKQARNNELRSAADIAAERVRRSGNPYAFAPMNSRERRLVHLAMRDFSDLRTESAGEGMNRCVVVYPKDYTGRPYTPPLRSDSRGGRGDDRRGGRGNRGGGGRGRNDRGGRDRGRGRGRR
jgi:spoIIIJ-associated protein